MWRHLLLSVGAMQCRQRGGAHLPETLRSADFTCTVLESHRWPFKVAAGPDDKPMVEGGPLLLAVHSFADKHMPLRSRFMP